jgi:hypothetical protein
MTTMLSCGLPSSGESELDDAVIDSSGALIKINNSDKEKIERARVFFSTVMHSRWVVRAQFTWRTRLNRALVLMRDKCELKPTFIVRKDRRSIDPDHTTYSIDIRLLRAKQAKADISHLGLVSVERFELPNDFERKDLYFADRKMIRYISDIHSKVWSLLFRVSKSSPKCFEK